MRPRTSELSAVTGSGSAIELSVVSGSRSAMFSPAFARRLDIQFVNEEGSGWSR